jgi:hypothetical protein
MRLQHLLLSFLAVGAVACGPKLTPPAAFAEIDDGAYDYRAATPRGVVVAARSEKNKPHANLAFWSDAVDGRLARQGYERRAETKVTTRRGTDGTLLAYSRADGGRQYEYMVALFVKSDRVYVVEAGGDKEDFEPARADVETAIRSLDE